MYAKQWSEEKKNPYGYMIADVFYLFLWDNIKLHTVNVSIVGFGVLVFSLWTHIFSRVYNLAVKTGMAALGLSAP